ncbi:hypothetical protein DFH28DRAFT_1095907 [Melampsora americana]|nr:hypothetical protein DFH28DRAFT_1095907 [Melampsora americana]
MSSSSDVVILPVATRPSLVTGINLSIDYTIWIRKTKAGKQSSEPTWEATKPAKKLNVLLTGMSTTSFESAKVQIFSEIKQAKMEAFTLLRAADNGEGDLGSLNWHAYISRSRVYPKTGDRIVFITNDTEWTEWLQVCEVSKDTSCGLHLTIENPGLAHKIKRQNEALVIEAAKVDRRRNRHAAKRAKKAKKSKKSNLRNNEGLTQQELVLDDDTDNDEDPELTTDDEAGESTGGDSDTDAIKIVSSDIYKRHPIRTDYCTSTPVYIDPLNKERFFYITADMARNWSKEKLKCDDEGTKVVTVDVPPKVPSMYWKNLSTEKSKRYKASSGNSTLQDMASMLKQVIASNSQPSSNAPQSSLGPTLKAPMADYLRYCDIDDPDGAIKDLLAGAGIDQYYLFNPDHLPREDLKELKLSIGTIARLYMNVVGFSKRLNDENMVPLRKQPPRSAKLVMKLNYGHSKVSFAAGPRKYRRKPMPGGMIPWSHPKRYPQLYKDQDELPDFDMYLMNQCNRDCKNSTPSQGLRWKREDASERKDLNRWTQATLAEWRSKEQAEFHQHFFFLKSALADLQNQASAWNLTQEGRRLAHQVLRSSSNAEEYYKQPVEDKGMWLKKEMIKFRAGKGSYFTHIDV